MARKITIAQNVGFCSGVQRAIKIARDSAAKYGQVAMLGDIVHNEIVVEDLRQAGIRVFSNLEEIPAGLPVLFRSHGTPVAIWEKARARNMEIIDATCPLVRKIHQEVKALAAEKRQIIIIGDHGHEEVTAIASQVQETIVVANPADAGQIGFFARLGIVVQSTQDIENVRAIVAVLVNKTNDLRVINTICQPTRQRQEQIRQLAIENDVMLIIGSKNSANTRRLTAIAQALNPHTYQIETSQDIQNAWFERARTVALATGASTPLELVDSVVKKISEIT